jgi:hypothetical protein
MRCSYCGNLIAVPEELWREVENQRTVKQWTRYVLIFLGITVGLPACLGIAGTLLGLLATLLGIGGTIFAAFLPFILSFFGK